jgi:DNA-binding NarL/FixJ family response regulator
MTEVGASMVRVLLAEDHTLVRDGLRLLLSVQPDMRLVAETDDGRVVMAMTRMHRPDVLLLDLGLPGMDGLDIMAELADMPTRPRVLVVTARLDAASARACLDLGADGYLPKSENSDALLAAIRVVARGETYVSPEIASLFEPATVATDPREPTSGLTAREREILALVGQGLSSKEIAHRLGISNLTVRKHRENLCRKLGARNAAELIARSIRFAG